MVTFGSFSAIACTKLGTCMILSSYSSTTLEDVAKASSGGLKWFQLYLYQNWELTKSLVKRVEEAGYKALVLTVDSPKQGKRLPMIKNNFTFPPHITFANFSDTGAQSSFVIKSQNHYSSIVKDPSLTWTSLDRLCRLTNLPVILKGILTAEDAREAVKHNVKGIIVSNHGGRQLDGVPATVSQHHNFIEKLILYTV